MTHIEPMLAETGDKSVLDRKDWLFEHKLDGVRCLARLNPFTGKTELQARSGNSLTDRFPDLAELHKQVSKPVLLDGEITGESFNAVQHRIAQTRPFQIKVAMTYYPARFQVFDILDYDHNLIDRLPLIERKDILRKALSDSDKAMVLNFQIGNGKDLLNATIQQRLEGIMAKQPLSPYQCGKRSRSWLKVKNFRESPFYIAGLTEGEGERAGIFGSVILATKVNGKLAYVGNVGSGFSGEQLRALLYLLTMYKQGDCPFETKPNVDRMVKFWTRPELRIEVRYLEVTRDGILRFPTFRKLVK